MSDEAKSKAELLEALNHLRQRVAALEVAIAQQSNQLRSLSTRLVEAEEIERQRLARELHDQVGQSLTAMGINLDIIRTLLPVETTPDIISHLEDTRALVTRTTKRVRQVMIDLRPETLDDYGLLAALHWSAERFSKRTGIAVNVEGEEATSRLPAPIENVLYRVTQEALTNVAKHAQATQVKVSLNLNSRTVYLVIADNGVGFDLNAPKEPDKVQWGLTIMVERVEGINGHFRLDTKPGQGTKIIVEVPR